MDQLPRPKICEKKLKTAEYKILKILTKLEKIKLNDSFVSKLSVYGKNERKGDDKLLKYGLGSVIILLVFGVYVTFTELNTERCQLELPSASKSVFRPPENCSMCVGVTGATRVANITARQFEEQYAYGTRPLIVTDAAMSWRAVKEFNYQFFKDFYMNAKMGSRINDCFYFAYKSGLNSLQDVFSMEEARANLTGEPWYVGWSTCYDEETRRLRSYYTRPYFLPESAESDMVDWIFMGGPGQGAHMHVDSVKHMSWQAQIRGRKQWELAPPPECLYVCHWFTFTVEPGEILVVDTNRWYHRTNVLQGDISITIGAEYD